MEFLNNSEDKIILQLHLRNLQIRTVNNKSEDIVIIRFISYGIFSEFIYLKDFKSIDQVEVSIATALICSIKEVLFKSFALFDRDVDGLPNVALQMKQTPRASSIDDAFEARP